MLGHTFKKYDYIDAIDIPKVSMLPKDYTGYMGVPVTFLDSYNPEMFEIINVLNHYLVIPDENMCNPPGTYATAIDGVPQYVRILIRRRFE